MRRRNKMSSFVVCGKCHEIRGGPIGEVEGVEVFQLCGCSTVEEHRAQPNVGDLNAVFELCRCCGLKALRRFTTDWALRHVIEPAFRGVLAYNERPTADAVVRVEVVDPENQFLKGVMGPNDDPQWWLEGSSYPIRIVDTERVKVLLTSRQLADQWGESPVAVVFPHGQGEVFHMISHYYLQRTEAAERPPPQRGRRLRHREGGAAGGRPRRPDGRRRRVGVDLHPPVRQRGRRQEAPERTMSPLDLKIDVGHPLERGPLALYPLYGDGPEAASVEP